MPVTFLYVGVWLREKRFFDDRILGSDAAYAQAFRRVTRGGRPIRHHHRMLPLWAYDHAMVNFIAQSSGQMPGSPPRSHQR